MSSLINKIEEKLSSSSSRDEEPNKLQKSPPEYSSNNRDTTDFSSRRTGDNTSGGTEGIQHPISTTAGRPTGSAVDGYGSNYITPTSQHGTQDSIPPSNVDNRVPGSWYTTDRTTGTSGLTHESSKYGEGSRHTFDPYNTGGQQTAANAVTGKTDAHRTQEGSVTNPAGDPRVQSSRGTAGDTRSATDNRYGAGQITLDHHYGRDAGIVGGTGAAGFGAYEAGKHSGTLSNTHYEPGRTYGNSLGQDRGNGTGSNLSNVSYMNRDNVSGQHNSSSRPFLDESSGRRGAGALDPNPHAISDRALARKMGAAYEAGYRDALEHLRAEYHQNSLGRNGTTGTSNTAGNSAYSDDYGAKEKPTIGEKLNPKKDADRDGKAGIMD